ncbi:hypothetical protein HG536_0G04510 [Torulaspora globosa]|uniref:BHLH domain-containing protein n=1 Tax=Torulaspora globosa TaxID=48254 RepID=A0A7G3ZM53_9SACH|nr:uncharacterized protein HG536_0G04510 [Torulaspora globosa]QLL34589.1 hypothetical protein HG536_0G04510 [Torulaspora globosa]
METSSSSRVMGSGVGKRRHGDVEAAEELKRQKQDEGNIDAALLNEVGDEEPEEQHRGPEEHDSHYDATAVAVASAAYSDLMQHPGEEKHRRALKSRRGDEDEEFEEEEEEEEELDDQIKDPDHIPEPESERKALLAGDEEDEDEEEGKKLFGAAAAGRRGRKLAPMTGSEEWKRQRKDSHKEVERRRRENINTAINKLSELLPVKESSKAAILARAAEYIQKLKETESANIDKWTLQKLLSEQNQSRLTSANERLQDELGKAYKEIEQLKHALKQAGLSYDLHQDHQKQPQDALDN